MFNPFAHQICFANLLRLSPSTWIGHTPFAMFLVDLLQPNIIIELGTYYGTSYCAFCQAVDQLQLNTKCYAIDTWQGDPQSGFYGNEILEDLRKYHDRLYGKFSRLIQSTFDESLIHFEDKSIDLLHIDGFHTYQEVKKDFNKWLPKISNQGIVLFHDINVRERDFGVWKFWKEIKVQYPNFEFVHSHGLGVIAVGENCTEEILDFLDFANKNVSQIQNFFYQLGMRFETTLETQNVQKIVESQSAILKSYQARETELQQSEENHISINKLKQEYQIKEEELIIEQQKINLERENLKLHLEEIEKKSFELEAEKINVEKISKKLIIENQHFFAKTIELQKLVSAIDKKEVDGKDLIKLLENKLAEIQHSTKNNTLKFVIGIVTYNNSEDQILQLLNSIEIAIDNANKFAINFEIFVIDNGLETIWSESSINIAKFNTLGNIGFGRGMNHLMSNAFANSEVQWFLCLNPDGVLHFNALSELLEASKINSDALLEARQFPAEHPKEYHPQTLETSWASGACLLITRSIFEELNGFDPNFFMYMEDIDLSWRARSAGFSVKIVPNALFGHSVLNRDFDPNIENHFFLSGRYLAYKWKNKDFLNWVEQELIDRGHFSSISELPQLPDISEEAPLNINVADFDHYFHFSKARW